MASLTRRQMLRRALMAAACALGGSTVRGAFGMGKASLLRLAALRYEGNWHSRPTALGTVLAEVDLRTSVRVSPEPATVAAHQEALFHYPLLWMTGDGEIEPQPEGGIENLRRHLKFGGTLFADDASGEVDSAFSRSLRRELGRVFPRLQLEPLAPDHAVYRAYYFLADVPGRIAVAPHLEGITIDDRAAVIFSANDLSGALERDAAGRWRFPVPSPQAQERTLALRLAVNLVIYAMTVNYKLDQVHAMYRMRHPRLYPGPAYPAPDYEWQR